MPSLSLEDIHRRIAQRDTELQALRQQLAARQSQLTSLTQRRQELQGQLQQVDGEMAAIAAGKRSTGTRPQVSTPAPKPGTTSTQTQPALPALLVSILREAGRSLTVTQLAEEAKRRGFQSSSGNFATVVQARVQDLRKRGSVQRAADGPGYTLIQTAKAKLASTASGRGAGETAGRANRKAPPPAAKSPSGVRAAKQPPLREVLTRILKKSRQPLTGGELAEAALQAGYRTTSPSLVDRVWVALSRMDNIEHVKGRGYRLKKGKG
jgi:hypothetical protein